MNTDKHSANNNSDSQQPWMMQAEHGPETFNYMISRPPGSVLPIPTPPLQHQKTQQAPHQQHHLPRQSIQQHEQQHTRPEEELSVSPPAQALNYNSDNPISNSKAHKGSANRAVIPSKRAAQNRAAQKAFRQRREQYIKDLEIKAKEMENWQAEMDKLRKENRDLRERISTLETQVNILTGGDQSKIPEVRTSSKSRSSNPDTSTATATANTTTTITKDVPSSTTTAPEIGPSTSSPAAASTPVPSSIRQEERSMSLPISANTVAAATPSGMSENDEQIIGRASLSPPVNIALSVTERSHNESRLQHKHYENNATILDNHNSVQQRQLQTPLQQQEGSFASVTLRAPNQTGFDNLPYHSNRHNTTLVGNDTTNNIKRRKLDDSLISSPQHIYQAPNSSSSPPQSQHAQVPHHHQNTQHYTHHNAMLPNPPAPSTHLLSIQQQQQQQHQPHPGNEFWSTSHFQSAGTACGDGSGGGGSNANMGDFDLDFDFDPFFEEELGPTITSTSDFLPNANSGQVLDDLFAMLQTRQRPQIPIVPTDDNNGNNNNNIDFNINGGGHVIQ